MAFDNPYWAGFAVAMVSLDTAGQSLNKAALRMAGTLLAVVVALTLVGLFPQQRWAMMLALSPYLGICVYMLTGPRRQYFWFVAAFVCIIIVIKGGGESRNTFMMAVSRVEETGLGILVYSLISIFLWPRNSRTELDVASRHVLDTQRGLWRAYRDVLAGRARDEDSRPLRLQEVQGLARLGQVLNGAEADTYEVWELRHAWRRRLQVSNRLLETLERWRVTFPELRSGPRPAALRGRRRVCGAGCASRRGRSDHGRRGSDAQTGRGEPHTRRVCRRGSVPFPEGRVGAVPEAAR
jgi:uncharacterized membrane protein YccC